MMRTLTDYGVNESADWDQMQSSVSSVAYSSAAVCLSLNDDS